MTLPNNDYIRHVTRCNPVVDEHLIPWYIGDALVGWLRATLAVELASCIQFEHIDGGLCLTAQASTFEERSQALSRAADHLHAQGLIGAPMGELYPVTVNGRDDALCVLDRAQASAFGIRTFGQHLNGFVRERGEIHMWLARRARDRLVFPGYLDQLVAGGLPWGISFHDNLVKECAEEAAIPADLVALAVPVGVVSYNMITEKGFRPDVLYCYDLELSADFEPRNSDGEVESFHLLPLAEVARLVRETDEFKPNCNLVIIDFLIRHGFIAPDTPEYLDLVTGLRPISGMTMGSKSQ